MVLAVFCEQNIKREGFSEVVSESTMGNPVIVSASTDYRRKVRGSLSSLSAADLGAAVVKEVVKRAGITGEMWISWYDADGRPAAQTLHVFVQLGPAGNSAGLYSQHSVRLQYAGGNRSLQANRLRRCGCSHRRALNPVQMSPYYSPSALGARMWDFTVYDDLHLDGFMCKLAGMLMGKYGGEFGRKIFDQQGRAGPLRPESHQKASKAVAEGKLMQRFYLLKLNKRKKEQWL